MMNIDCKVLAFFEKSVCEFYEGRIDWHDTASRFESEVVVSLGGLYVDPEYRKWIGDCIVHIRHFWGIRDLAYVLLAVWYCYYPESADSVMLRFVVGGSGTWGDIKRFLRVWRELGYHKDSRNGGAVSGRVVAIMIDQLWADYQMERYGCGGVVAKWVPREKSPRYGWLYDHFVIAWAAKTGWSSGGRMDKWRRRFRKVLARMEGGTAAPKARRGRIYPKDLVRLAIEGGGDRCLDQKWYEILERFCSICDLPLDIIPIVAVEKCWGEELYSKLAYVILISQHGIGRIMFQGGYCLVATKYDNFSDIISRIRGVLNSGGGGCVMDIIREASEVSGYENPQVLMI